MYHPKKYPFTISISNQCASGATESELHFEGAAIYHHDKQTEMAYWEVIAVCTGATQYQGGRVVNDLQNIKVPAQDVVKNWKEFEEACIDRATFQFELKQAA